MTLAILASFIHTSSCHTGPCLFLSFLFLDGGLLLVLETWLVCCSVTIILHSRPVTPLILYHLSLSCRLPLLVYLSCLTRNASPFLFLWSQPLVHSICFINVCWVNEQKNCQQLFPQPSVLQCYSWSCFQMSLLHQISFCWKTKKQAMCGRWLCGAGMFPGTWWPSVRSGLPAPRPGSRAPIYLPSSVSDPRKVNHHMRTILFFSEIYFRIIETVSYFSFTNILIKMIWAYSAWWKDSI